MFKNSINILNTKTMKESNFVTFNTKIVFTELE